VLEAVVTTKVVPVAAPKDKLLVVAKAKSAFTEEAEVATKLVPVAVVKVRAWKELIPLTVRAVIVVVAKVVVPVKVLSPAKYCVVVEITPLEVVPAFGIVRV
jgi:hypothetical protein